LVQSKTTANTAVDTTAKTITDAFTKEEQLTQRYSADIKTFWQQGHFSSFSGQKGIRLNYAIFTQPLTDNLSNKDSIVIVSGRSEGYLKYQELCFDLFQLGYNIFIVDHRGQGISERMLSEPHKGYVENFDYYYLDLATFITDVVTKTIKEKQLNKKPYLLSHSMGGAISARYLQHFPQTIKAAVLSSPMIAINSGGLPISLARALIFIGSRLNHWFGKNPWYFIGQNGYNGAKFQRSFSTNPLMHSSIRYQLFSELYQTNKTIQLGGVTVKWLVEALKTEKAIFAKLENLTTPTLVIQAGDDKIVDNSAQNEFCEQLNALHPYSCPEGKPITVEGAYHELFFEQDQYRVQALSATVNWFKQH
jgi:lysophospholipase